jgi:putative two-component system response regulator
MPKPPVSNNCMYAFKPRPSILLVDDEPLNLQVLKQILQEDYHLLFARDGARALVLAQQEKPDLILLDIMMPGLTGIETCQALKANPLTKQIPVIFITALNEEDSGTEGFDAGCVDYITKPVSASIVLARVKTHLSLVHTEHLSESRLQIIRCLGRAAEYKDNETGMHVIRMSYYARAIAEALQLDADYVETLFLAAPMHDVGKIGIPDAVLLKPGKLSPEEWAIMKTHCAIGAEIIGKDDSPIIAMARSIALHHHEKWNGSGYPQGLAAEAIPLEGRIIAIADVFDALTSERPYKRAWSFDQAIDFIKAEAGKHFDPAITLHLDSLMPRFREIYQQFRELAVGVEA